MPTPRPPEMRPELATVRPPEVIETPFWKVAPLMWVVVAVMVS